jgi:SAM-dependent MidA family methyltransferase
MDLPEPDAELRAHSARMVSSLRAQIERDGPITFERYMEQVLYAPGLGYYSAGLRKFGWGGDFVTAPELGSLFAECVAQAIAPVLRQLSYPVIMEVGAGTGAFAADLWLALEKVKALPERYLILERSADLRERQIEKLSLRAPQALPRVAWLDEPPREAFDGVLFGNEVIDALPAARFEWSDDQLYELGVDWTADTLREVRLPPRENLSAAVQGLRADLSDPWPDGYRSDLLLNLPAWLSAVSASLREGVAIFADYGYPASEHYAAARADGTLVGHFRQRFLTDPYWYPGLVDLSVSVDFTALAHAADANAFRVAGFSSQAQFLIAAGIAERLQDGVIRNERQQLKRNEEARKLTLPGEMGERFKVMSLVRGIELDALPVSLRLPFELHRL